MQRAYSHETYKPEAQASELLRTVLDRFGRQRFELG